MGQNQPPWVFTTVSVLFIAQVKDRDVGPPVQLYCPQLVRLEVSPVPKTGCPSISDGL